MKSKRFKIIFLVFVAVVLTTFIMSGTYAKYVSSIDMVDEARVAKWDINFLDESGEKIVNFDLFSKSYFNEDNPVVKSKNGDKVVAPGTSGEYTFKIVGNPEVRYKISIVDLGSYDTINNVDLDIDGDEGSKRILYTLDKGTDGEVSTYNIYELLYSIQTLYNREYPGALSDDFNINDTHTISWVWKFEDENDKSDKNKISTNDKTDTDLGKQAIIDMNATQKKVRFKFKVVAEQVTLPNGQLVSADK